MEPVSCEELYEKFHELYMTVIRHIICNTKITRIDNGTVDEEMLHRVQEYCLAGFDELNLSKYQDALDNVPYAEQSALVVLPYTLSNIGDSELLSIIKDRYKGTLSEEEFDMLCGLSESVYETLSSALSASCKFLMSTNGIRV